MLESLKKFGRDGFAIAAFTVPFAAYLLTLAPTVYWLDSGIYLAAARELGVAYPPGFPLYVMLSFLAGLVPFGSFAERIHALSAIAGALACLTTYYTVLLLAGDGRGEDHGKISNLKSQISSKSKIRRPEACAKRSASGPDLNDKKQRGRGPDDGRPNEEITGIGVPARTRLHALLAAWTLAFSFALWSQSVNSEVYSLQALITALLVFFFARLETGPERPFRATILPIAIVAGLGFANHPMIVGMLPALGYAVWRHRAVRKSWLMALPVFIAAGFLPYLYIPFRSAANPLTDWGDAENVENFIKLVTAQHWTTEGSSFSFFGAGFRERGADAARLFFLQFWPAALALGAYGAVKAAKRQRGVLVFLALTAFFALLIPLLYTQTKEFESWFLAAYVAFAPCVGVGAIEAAKTAASFWKSRPGTAAAAVAAAFALFGPALLFATSLPAANRSGDYEAEDYGRAILNSAGENGILFISGDNPSSTVLYLQAAQGMRRDVAVLNQEALTTPWYRGYARRNVGISLAEGVDRGEMDATRWVLAVMAENPNRPAYTLMPGHLALPGDLHLVPSGMVYRISMDDAPEPSSRWDFELHDPEEISRDPPFDQRRKINEAHREMRAGFLRAYDAGGEAFARSGDLDGAARLFARADRIVPTHESFFLDLGVSKATEGDFEGARRVFEGLVERMPSSARGHLDLGHVLSELGDDEGARREYRKALDIDPGFELARKSLEEAGARNREGGN